MARVNDQDTHPKLYKKHKYRTPRTLDPKPTLPQLRQGSRRRDPDMIARAKTMWAEGMSTKNICYQLGIGPSTLRNIRLDNNLPARTTSEGLGVDVDKTVIPIAISMVDYRRLTTLSYFKRTPIQRLLRKLIREELVRNSL